jgi:hypothetical protein
MLILMIGKTKTGNVIPEFIDIRFAVRRVFYLSVKSASIKA